MGRAGDATGGQTEDIPPGLPQDEFLLFVGELSRIKACRRCCGLTSRSAGTARHCCWSAGARQTRPTHLPDGAEMCAEWPHEHVMAAFRRCLFAVLPSICLDACPTTVLEAMASGRPVIATATGGIVDMIADGENGLLVPAGNESRLAEAMARLLNDSDLRVRLAAGAQERVRRFTASAVAERLEAVYARVAPRNSRVSLNPAGRARGETLTDHDL